MLKPELRMVKSFCLGLIRKKSKRKLHKDDITIVDTKVAKKAVVATALGNPMLPMIMTNECCLAKFA